MDVHKAKNELRKMKRRDLLGLASNQKISKCLLGGKSCVFYLHHKGLHFCVSEILGESCLFERLEKLEEQPQSDREINFTLPLIQSLGSSPPFSGKKTSEFKVYYRDEVTRSMILLGGIVERRIKERGNNLRDLLIKARSDYSNRVSDPSMIFLLGP